MARFSATISAVDFRSPSPITRPSPITYVRHRAPGGNRRPLTLNVQTVTLRANLRTNNSAVATSPPSGSHQGKYRAWLPSKRVLLVMRRSWVQFPLWALSRPNGSTDAMHASSTADNGAG